MFSRCIFSSRSSSITSIRSTYAGSDANSYDCFLIHRDDFSADNQQFDTVDTCIDDEELIQYQDIIEEKCNKFDDKENINSEKSHNNKNCKINNTNSKQSKHYNKKKRSDSEHNLSINNISNNNANTNGIMPPTTTKLPGRQTNNSLSSITGQIVIQTPPPTPQSATNNAPSTSRKKKAKTEV